MKITLVVAVSENNVIGKSNKLLWHLPNDLKYFKNVTWAMPVIMGRKTFESLGKPLDGRYNIVISNNKDWKPEGVIVVHDLREAYKAAEVADTKEVFVLGGGQIYAQAIVHANKIHLTRVHAQLEGDTHFPMLDKSWQLSYRVDFPKDEKHAYPYSIEIWESNRPAETSAKTETPGKTGTSGKVEASGKTGSNRKG
ncbi:MAG TPA: dihydrofolate reductase [Flavitalea sp.]|nr:dihydrofolate reductase [Flavitalea sp.]